MPHITTWDTGFKSDLTVKQQQMVITLPRQAIHGLSPTKQIDAIRSWLGHGSRKKVFPKTSLHDSVHCVTAIADQLRLNIESGAFRNAIKKYNWKRPAKIWTSGAKTRLEEAPPES